MKRRSTTKHPAASTVHQWIGRITLAFAALEHGIERTLKIVASAMDDEKALKAWKSYNSFSYKCDLLEKFGGLIISASATLNPKQRGERLKRVITECRRVATERNSFVHAVIRDWAIDRKDFSTIVEISVLTHPSGDLAVDRNGLVRLKELYYRIGRLEALVRHHRSEIHEYAPQYRARMLAGKVRRNSSQK